LQGNNVWNVEFTIIVKGTAMDSTRSKARRLANVLVEEPDAGIPLVRICGGFGRVISHFYPENQIRISASEAES